MPPVLALAVWLGLALFGAVGAITYARTASAVSLLRTVGVVAAVAVAVALAVPLLLR